MNRKKQFLSTAAGLVLVGLLFMAAIVFPEYFKNYTDKRLLNKMEYVDASYDIYEVTYTSFIEKIKAIGKITNTGNSYNSVKINDTDFDYKYINKIIRKEFNDLYKCGILNKKIKLRAKQLSLCEKYMLYPSASEDNIKGISFIKAVYKLKKGIIEVYIDEEYHKIYDFIIPWQLYYRNNVIYSASVHTDSNTGSYDTISIEEKYSTESYYLFITNLMKYYYGAEAQDSASLLQCIESVYYNGFMEFEDGIKIEAGRWEYYDIQDNVHIGINLKHKL